MNPQVFKKVFEWLYTGQTKLSVAEYDDAILLSSQCRLPQLKSDLLNGLTKANAFGKKGSENGPERADLD